MRFWFLFRDVQTPTEIAELSLKTPRPVAIYLCESEATATTRFYLCESEATATTRFYLCESEATATRFYLCESEATATITPRRN